MAYEDVLYETRDGVALITFNRPAALNALRQQTIAELLDVLRRIEADASLRAVVLTGSGRAFSAGRDLKDRDALTATPTIADDVAAVVEQYQELTRRITRLDRIFVSALNGVAVGIGAELAAACDIRLASSQATIAFPELQRALFLTNGILHRLPRLVGLGRATEWILSGRMIGADELLATGFVSRVVDGTALLDDALGVAASIVANAPVPTRMAKELLNRTYELDLATVLDLEREALVRCVQTEDYREGVRAFLEKREPRFSGR
jgi:enoyl-CoA hydratase/carnithine racemase